MGVSGLGSGLSIAKEVRTINAATWTGGVATYTTTAAHGLGVGVLVRIVGISPAAYNVVGYTTTGTTGSTVKVAIASDPGSYSSGGTLHSVGMTTTPTRIIRMREQGEGLGLDVAKIETKLLSGGSVLPQAIGVRQGRRKVMGDTNGVLFDDGEALLWELMLGAVATSGSGPYTHTFTLGQYLPSATMQVSVGSEDDTMLKEMTGMMVDSWALACVAGEIVTLGITWVGKTLALTLADDLDGTAPTGLVAYNFTDGVVTVAGANPGCVKAIRFNGANNLDSDSLCVGSTSIAAPERGDEAAITGEIEVELNTTDKTIFDAYVAGTQVAVQLVLTQGPATVTIALTGQIMADPTPKVSGPGKLTFTAPFKCFVTEGNTDAQSFSVVVVNGDSAP